MNMYDFKRQVENEFLRNNIDKAEVNILFVKP